MTTLTAPPNRQHHIRHTLRLAVGLVVVVLLVVVGVILATRGHANSRRAAACEAGWRRQLAAAVSVNPASTFASQHTKWIQTCNMGYPMPYVDH